MDDKTNSVLMIFSACVALFAGIFLLSADWDFSTTQYVVAGLIIAFAGVLSAGPSGQVGGAFAAITFGAYLILRGMGVLTHQYFRFGLGIVLVGLAIFIFYRFFSARLNN